MIGFLLKAFDGFVLFSAIGEVQRQKEKGRFTTKQSDYLKNIYSQRLHNLWK